MEKMEEMGLAERILTQSVAELSVSRLSFSSKFIRQRYVHLDATPRFDSHVFIEQFLCHLLFPLSIFYVRRIHGKSAPRNQIFTKCGTKVIFWQLISHTFWMLIVVFIWKHDELNKSGITDSEFGLVIMAGIIFRGMVASKYASLSPKEYEIYLSIEDEEESDDMRNQLQLNTGWVNIDLTRMIYESELALTRLGIYRDRCSIPFFEIHQRDASKWYEFLGENAFMLKQMNNNIYTVEIPSFMAACFEMAKNKKLSTLSLYIGILASLILGMLPNLVRMNCRELVTYTSASNQHQLCPSSCFFGNGILANCYSVVLMLQGITVAIPLNSFLFSLVLSSLRLYKCEQMFGMIIRNDVRAYDHFPVLDLMNTNNIRAWVRSFEGLYQVGARYKQRIDWYSKFCAYLLVVLIIWVFYTFFRHTYHNDDDDDDDDVRSNDMMDDNVVSNNDDDGSTPNSMFVNVAFWLVMYLLIVWGSAFALTLAVMAANNKAALRQELELLQRRLCLREHLHNVRGVAARLTDENDEKKANMRNTTTIPSSVLTSPLLTSSSSSHQGVGEDYPLEYQLHRRDVKPNQERQMNNFLLEKTTSELEAAEASFEELDDLLDTAVKIIEGQLRVEPHRFLGANGSWRLVGQFLIVWVTTIGAVLGIAGIKTD